VSKDKLALIVVLLTSDLNSSFLMYQHSYQVNQQIELVLNTYR
jgi:hypothetical protein